MRPAAASTCGFVLDNSVLCGWFLANQADDCTEAIAALLLESEAAALAEAAWAAGVGVVKG